MIRFVFTKREIAIAMVAGLVFGLLTGSSARAQQAPRANCVAVTKQEYNNARKPSFSNSGSANTSDLAAC